MVQDLSAEFLTTRELADLLHIKERKVYELAASGQVPCSRATGKLLFPRQGVEAWIAGSSSGPRFQPDPERAPVVAGSHDPLLDWSLRESRAGLATYFDGSLDGLERFAARRAVATGLHVFDAGSGEWNGPLVVARFSAQAVVLMEFAWRERGLIVASGAESEIRDLTGLRGLRVVPRQPEAGCQLLFEHLLAVSGVEPGDLQMIPPVRTETDAALAVADGKADVAFGLLGLARRFGLGFLPVIRERFDLLVDRRHWFEPPLQRFLSFCHSELFRTRAEELRGYDVAGFGRIHFNGP